MPFRRSPESRAYAPQTVLHQNVAFVRINTCKYAFKNTKIIAELKVSHIRPNAFLLVQCCQRRRYFMREQKRILELTNFEWWLFIACLNTARSKYIDEGKPIEDVNVLLIKTMNAKSKKARI